MSLLIAFTVENSHILGGTSYIKLEKLLIPNLDLSQKIKKIVIKQDKFLGFYANWLL